MEKSVRAFRLLVVEDNPDDEMMTRRGIEHTGLRVQTSVVSDGEAALHYLSSDDLPDLVLLDLKLPRLSGLDVLKTIRADHRTRTLPIVFFTSSNEPRDILSCYNYGANCYVQKPVDFERFLSAVALTLQFWISTAKLPNRP